MGEFEFCPGVCPVAAVRKSPDRDRRACGSCRACNQFPTQDPLIERNGMATTRARRDRDRKGSWPASMPGAELGLPCRTPSGLLRVLSSRAASNAALPGGGSGRPFAPSPAQDLRGLRRRASRSRCSAARSPERAGLALVKQSRKNRCPRERFAPEAVEQLECVIRSWGTSRTRRIPSVSDVPQLAHCR